MRVLSPEATLGELLREHPDRARVFERLGIDCDRVGEVPLARSCAERGIDVAELLRALDADDARAAVPLSDEWVPATLAERIDRIVAVHHGHLRRELPRLAALLARVADLHGDGHPELGELREVFGSFRAELESHLLREEWVVFPAIRRLEPRAVDGTPDVALGRSLDGAAEDHRRACAALSRMNVLASGFAPPDDAGAPCRSLLAGLAALERDMDAHHREEEDLLFAGARDVLDGRFPGQARRGAGEIAGGP